MNLATSAARSARTGRFVTKEWAARSPRTTTIERIGTGTSNKTAVNRSAATGRFVTAQTARRNPGGTITQMV
ncbi:ABC transporter ATP-binding protein [Georgenia subflava]|uniref:ABC transporter ATP-binding protein n=1 Tax=Georgenia subflava TaxID=1622177 RepID=A0A6N7EGE3_9MICO|nr:ABC transporter ATP-binding protein [Georgenia subflava]